MTEDNLQQQEQSPPKLGPGDKLQSARISIGMTLEDVARKMHLSSCIVTSLEENNFNEITAPIFVKGYLRAYSRLVNVSEEEIIELYTTYYMDGDPPILSTSNTSTELNAEGFGVKWITYIVILGLIVLLSSWWWHRYQQSPETLSLDSGNKTGTQTELVQVDTPANAVDKSQEKAEESVADAARESLQPEVTSIVKAIDVDISQTQTLTVETKPAATESSAAPAVVETEQATVDLTKKITQAEQPTTQTTVSENNTLVITVIADTWASVKDATGKKLVYELLHSGDEVTVTGEAPLRAFLGNGYGVTMKYQGQVIDLSQVIRSDNTARIKIGQ